MSKITNDGSTRSGTGCFISTHTAKVGIKGLMLSVCYQTLHLHSFTYSVTHFDDESSLQGFHHSTLVCAVAMSRSVLSVERVPASHPCRLHCFVS